MRRETERLLETTGLGVLRASYPRVGDLLMSLRMEVCDDELTLLENLAGTSERYLADFGTTRERLLEDVARAIESAGAADEPVVRELDSLTIAGGRDKDGNPELPRVELRCGEVVGIVGKTGSGKSRLLGDIESLAQGDTPTGRRIYLNGEAPDEALRESIDNRLVAQLSQNMNFIMDHTVARFLEMHARCREVADVEGAIRDVFGYANTLAGEPFALETPVTQLSGGQSRALMIADTLILSSSPIILIDEIENAGIDKRKAVELLAREDKIVLIATHDPLLALSCGRRLVIRNGGIAAVVERGEREARNLELLERYDRGIMAVRDRLRAGELIDGDLSEVFG